MCARGCVYARAPHTRSRCKRLPRPTPKFRILSLAERKHALPVTSPRETVNVNSVNARVRTRGAVVGPCLFPSARTGPGWLKLSSIELLY